MVLISLILLRICLILAKATILDRSMHICVSRVRLHRLLLYCVWESERIAWVWIELRRRRCLIERIAGYVLCGAVRDLLRVIYLHVHRIRIVLRKEQNLIFKSCMKISTLRLTKDVSLIVLAATGSQALCSSKVGSAHGCNSPDAKIP